jgi:hypothetical protein
VLPDPECPSGTSIIPSATRCGSRLTTTTRSLPGAAVVARIESVVAGRKARFDSACSAGFSRRIRFRARIIGLDVAGLVEVPHPDLVLLRVEVLLGARANRGVLAELVAAVDAVEWRQRPGEQEADAKRRAPSPAAGTRAGCPACW